MATWRRVLVVLAWLLVFPDLAFTIFIVSETFVRHASIADITFGGLLSLIMLAGGVTFALAVERLTAALDRSVERQSDRDRPASG